MRTQHRRAAHAKRQILPKWFLPKLTPAQTSSCKLAHWDLIGRITSGRATEHDLWDMVHTGLTYSELMRLLEQDGTEFTDEAKAAIAEHLETFPGVVERYRRTGRVGFNGEQLLAARAAAELMEQLIEMDRFGFAVRATAWATARVDAIRESNPMPA